MGLRDINYAVRSLVIDRGVSTIVIVCLALGIGVNATLFSLIDGVLIQPLPFSEPDRLLVLNENSERRGIREEGVAYRTLQDWKERTTTFASMAGTSGTSIALSDGGEAERFQGAAITWDAFPILGVNPVLGRHFRQDDDRRGAEPVVMLSHEVWQRRYQGDLNIVGRSITVNGKPTTVIGVMPIGFSFPENQKVWIPVGPRAETQPRTERYLFAFGCLKPGVDLAQARAELTSMTSSLATMYPTTNDGWSAMARPLSDEFIPDDVRLVLLTMMGAVTIVLLIACANVANLMLARASGRQREFCVRAALGAGRARLIKQLLTECVLLGLASAPLGLGLAYVGIWMLDNAVPPGMVPHYIHWEISTRGIAYTIGISALTGLVFGLAPALQASRLNLQEALRDGARGSGQSGRRARLRDGLVVIEVAMAASPGFDTSQLLTARFFMVGEAYTTDEQKAQRVDDVMRRVEALPGVTSAFASNFVPLDAGGGNGHAIVDGRAVPQGEEPTILYTAVTAHFYKTMGLALLKGRDFTDAEGIGRTPVAVINETMAKKLWPGTDAVGRRFRLVETEPAEWFTVIGVTPDIRMFDMDDDTPDFSVAYVPYRFSGFANIGVTIRAAKNPALLSTAVRIALGATRADVLGLVVRQGVTLAATGVIIGLLGAFGVTRLIRSLLYNVTPTDPLSFLGAARPTSIPS